VRRKVTIPVRQLPGTRRAREEADREIPAMNTLLRAGEGTGRFKMNEI
jgi:hypothetical protein